MTTRDRITRLKGRLQGEDLADLEAILQSASQIQADLTATKTTLEQAREAALQVLGAGEGLRHLLLDGG